MINVYWIIIVALAVVSQYYIIEKKEVKPNKALWFGIRVIIAVGFFYFYQKLGYDPVWSIGYMVGTFWGPFNESLNKLRGKPWGYLGDDWVDKILRKIMPDNLIVLAAELLLFLWGVGAMLVYGKDTNWADLM